jgi:hypothetical protein
VCSVCVFQSFKNTRIWPDIQPSGYSIIQ